MILSTIIKEFQPFNSGTPFWENRESRYAIRISKGQGGDVGVLLPLTKLRTPYCVNPAGHVIWDTSLHEFLPSDQ